MDYEIAIGYDFGLFAIAYKYIIILGFDMESKEYIVKGMHCASCSSLVEDRIGKLDGVSEAFVNLATEKLYIKSDGLDFAEIEKVIKASGFTVEEVSDDSSEALEKKK